MKYGSIFKNGMMVLGFCIGIGISFYVLLLLIFQKPYNDWSFINKINMALQKNPAGIILADIVQGDWDAVCYYHGNSATDIADLLWYDFYIPDGKRVNSLDGNRYLGDFEYALVFYNSRKYEFKTIYVQNILTEPHGQDCFLDKQDVILRKKHEVTSKITNDNSIFVIESNKKR